MSMAKGYDSYLQESICKVDLDRPDYGLIRLHIDHMPFPFERVSATVSVRRTIKRKLVGGRDHAAESQRKRVVSLEEFR